MADNSLIKSGFTVSPKTGTGNATLTIAGSERTGRLDADAVTFTATLDKFPSVSKSFKVVQKGKPEFITVETKIYSATAIGQNVTIQGKSNSANLKIVAGASSISGLVYKLAVAGVTDESWNGSSDTTVDGDPGASAAYDFTLTVTIPENKSESAKLAKFAVKNANGNVTSGEITINQAAGVKNYADAVIEKLEFPMAAAGGPKDIDNGGVYIEPEILLTRTWGWNESKTNGGTITVDTPDEIWNVKVVTDAPITVPDSLYFRLLVASKGTTVSGITEYSVALTFTMSLGTDVNFSKTVTVKQAANTATYSDIIFSSRVPSASDIRAVGGAIGGDNIVWSGTGEIAGQTITYTSTAIVGITNDKGSTNPAFDPIAITYSDAVTAASKGTEVSGRTEAGVITITATGAGGKKATKSLTVYQEANTSTYAVPTFVAGNGITIDSDNAVTINWGADANGIMIFSEAGDGVFKNMKQVVTYTSGESKTVTATAAELQNGGSFSGSVESTTTVDGFRLSGSVIQTKQVAVTKNSTVVARNGFKVKVSVTMNDKSTESIITFNQAAAAAYLTVSSTTIDFAADGSTSTLTIESNDSWTIS